MEAELRGGRMEMLNREGIVKVAEDNGLKTVKMVQVIEVRFRKGAGLDPSALREVVSYYHPDGRLIAMEDPCAERAS